MRRHSSKVGVPKAALELSGVELGDARRNARARKIIAKLETAPRKSFPKLAADDAELEAIYRFFSNEDVSWEAILKPHAEATARRCQSEQRVLVVHDSSEFKFSGDREMPVLLNNTQGFLGHFSLAVSEGEHRTALGVLAMNPVFRAKREGSLNERKLKTRATPREEKESARWEGGVRAAAELIGSQAQLIHVADQEADDYALLSLLLQGGHRFVIRGSAERLLRTRGGPKVRTALDAAEHRLFREVALTERKGRPSGPQAKKSHPPREFRQAELHLRATTLTLERPLHAQAEASEVPLNVVQVFEPSPPEGEPPVEWTLFTNESIETREDIERVVDAYRSRWTIEEYFKAVKTGCAFQSRQLGSKGALLNALALTIPVAWRLLLLRSLGRRHPDLPATVLFTNKQLRLMELIATKVHLPKSPTVRDAMLVIAAIGGHLRRNGDPGWQTLAAGHEEFIRAEALARTLGKM